MTGRPARSLQVMAEEAESVPPSPSPSVRVTVELRWPKEWDAVSPDTDQPSEALQSHDVAPSEPEPSKLHAAPLQL